MRLPKELTTVTPLSKTLALILFIVLPFIGFFVGVRYETMNNSLSTVPDYSNIPQKNTIITQPPTPFISPSLSIQNTPTITSTDSASIPQVIPLESTQGWKEVNISGIKLKVPADARVESLNNTDLIYVNPNDHIPLTISVGKYSGGSRRAQFLSTSSYPDCHWIYQEAKFGSVQALQIAADGGWCQGGAGGIVTVLGDKFITFQGLNYNVDTKIIDRWTTKDTIVSTIQLQ